MFIKDLQTEFYQVIHGQQILLLVNFDVDAICASKILQDLFKHDNITYTLVPVQGIQDLVRAYEDNSEEIAYVIMINCGGILDILELLQPEENVTFFILDSHRPFHLCNIYNDKQVHILGEPTEEEQTQIPEYNDIYHDTSDEEEDLDDLSDEENESAQAKRRRLLEAQTIKRKERRQWEEKREELLFNYLQYSYYGKSSALTVYEMTWQASRDSLDMIWWAIIGSTEQAILNKVDSTINTLDSGFLQGHVSRLSHARRGDGNEQQKSAMKIIYEKDLKLALYRHWTVEDSLRHSMITSVTLRLWSIKGEQKLKQLLAEMGLPLDQSRQQFSAMDLNLKNEFKEMVEKLADKYEVGSIIGASFTLHNGYRFKYCASDVVYAMLAVMESTSKDRPAKLCFLEASNCLTRTNKDILDKAIERAKNVLVQIFKTAQTILELKQVINTGAYLYIVLTDRLLHCHIFSHPHALLMLAQFTLRAYVASSRSRYKAAALPLVASAVHNEEEKTCLLVGIPPVSEEQPRSLFGRAFEQAAKNTNSDLEADYFDTTIVRLKIEDRPKFFDALAALME